MKTTVTPGTTTPTKPPPIPLMIILGLIAIAASVGSVMMFIADRNFAATAEKVEGTVVDLEASTSRDSQGKSSTTYHPIVEFQWKDRTIRFRSSVGSSPPSYSVGDTVPVLHAPGKPNDAKIDSFSSRFLFPLVLLAIGVITGLITAALVVARIKGVK